MRSSDRDIRISCIMYKTCVKFHARQARKPRDSEPEVFAACRGTPEWASEAGGTARNPDAPAPSAQPPDWHPAHPAAAPSPTVGTTPAASASPEVLNSCCCIPRCRLNLYVLADTGSRTIHLPAPGMQAVRRHLSSSCGAVIAGCGGEQRRLHAVQHLRIERLPLPVQPAASHACGSDSPMY